MKQVQIVLLTALLVVLSVIAYDLHTIAREMAPSAALSAGVVNGLAPANETPEQHKARIQREADRLNQIVNDEAEVLRKSFESEQQKRAAKR